MPSKPMRGGRVLPLTAVDAVPRRQGEGKERRALEARPQDGRQEEERHRRATKFASHSVSHPPRNLPFSTGDGQCCGLLKAVTVAVVSFFHIYIRIRYTSRNIYIVHASFVL